MHSYNHLSAALVLFKRNHASSEFLNLCCAKILVQGKRNVQAQSSVGLAIASLVLLWCRLKYGLKEAEEALLMRGNDQQKEQLKGSVLCFCPEQDPIHLVLCCGGGVICLLLDIVLNICETSPSSNKGAGFLLTPFLTVWLMKYDLCIMILCHEFTCVFHVRISLCV